ncbi:MULTISPECIES: glycosyltransferase [unclassified Rhodococcus (in: high G+C Gram-positive bacteria)]|uniref:glycosyltransferase n=1 Tax=unclassified Rhodococcus (in: high G+C Gram-positive bacteria) TaxID=192944 RepID=UPI000A5FB893|nr:MULTISPECIES: glycosyltransferase [unclassified Rhodococcus (in: high G+C Gram-positive bacteria)]
MNDIENTPSVTTALGPVRVLHVTEAFGGGIQTAIASYVANSPVHVTHSVIARERSGHETHADLGCPVQLVRGSLRQFFASVSAEVTRLSPDIVHLHSSFAGAYRLLASRKLKLIYTPHAFAFLRADVSRLSRLTYLVMELAFARRAHVVAAISPYEYRLARRLSPRRTEVLYLPNVVIGDGEQYSDEQSVVASGSIDIITIGRITAQKDPHFVADVARHTEKNLRWVWVGDGDASGKDALLSAGIEVSGWLPNSEVMKLLRQSRVYVHGAAWEGAPVTLLEAVANGTPVIARDVPTLIGLGFPSGGDTAEKMASSIREFFLDDANQQKVRDLCGISARVHSRDVQHEALQRLYAGFPLPSVFEISANPLRACKGIVNDAEGVSS